MEISWRYAETMRRFAQNCAVTMSSITREDCQYSAILRYKFQPRVDCEMPVFGLERAINTANNSSIHNPVEVFIPLNTPIHIQRYATIDPILRTLCRYSSYTRLNGVSNTKGNVYYGSNGLILDKDFNPLVLVTRKVHWDDNGVIHYGNFTVHLHPNIFINDKDPLCHSIATKGITFFLTQLIVWDCEKAKVVIDDCSNFVTKPNEPDITKASTKYYNTLLKRNINDVLIQFEDDQFTPR